jgi:hypothetical protein
MNAQSGINKSRVHSSSRKKQTAISAIVIANKMEDIEDIENFYEREIEKADKEFLSGLKQKKDNKDKEKRYKESLKNIQEQYKKKYERYLSAQKEGLSKNKKHPGPKEGKKEKLKTKSIDFKKLDKEEKKRLNKEIFKFKTRLKMHKFYRKATPKFLIITYLKIKFKIRNCSHELSLFASDMNSKVKEGMIISGSKVKGISKGASSWINNITYSVRKKFKRKEDKKTVKSEEEQLLEKIMNK